MDNYMFFLFKKSVWPQSKGSLVQHQVVVPVPPGSGQKPPLTSFLWCIPHWNTAVVILTLLPVQHLFNGSWSHHLGKWCWGKTKQVTPLAMPSVLVPCSVYKLREANHNFTLWFVKSHSSTGGIKKTFKSPDFMAYRITAFPYSLYCSKWALF